MIRYCKECQRNLDPKEIVKHLFDSNFGKIGLLCLDCDRKAYNASNGNRGYLVSD